MLIERLCGQDARPYVSDSGMNNVVWDRRQPEISIIAIDQHDRRPEGNSYTAALGHVFASNPTGLNITKDIVVATQEQDAMTRWI